MSGRRGRPVAPPTYRDVLARCSVLLAHDPEGPGADDVVAVVDYLLETLRRHDYFREDNE